MSSERKQAQRPGRPAKDIPETTLQRVRELHVQGVSTRKIASATRLSRWQVRSLLAEGGRKTGENSPAASAEFPSAMAAPAAADATQANTEADLITRLDTAIATCDRLIDGYQAAIARAQEGQALFAQLAARIAETDARLAALDERLAARARMAATADRAEAHIYRALALLDRARVRVMPAPEGVQ